MNLSPSHLREVHALRVLHNRVLKKTQGKVGGSTTTPEKNFIRSFISSIQHQILLKSSDQKASDGREM